VRFQNGNFCFGLGSVRRRLVIGGRPGEVGVVRKGDGERRRMGGVIQRGGVGGHIRPMRPKTPGEMS